MAVNKELLPNLKYSEVLVFASAFSILYYWYKQNVQLSVIPQITIKNLLPNRSDRDVIEKTIKNTFFGPQQRVNNNNDEWKLSEIVSGTIKNFTAGFLIQSAVSLFQYWKKSNSQTGLGHLNNCFSLGSFLGSLLLINRSFSALYRKWTHSDPNRPIPLLLNAFLCGLTMIFYPSPAIASLTLSNTLFTCAGQFITSYPKLESFYYPSLFYGLSTAISIFALYFHNDSVPISWKEGLLNNLGGSESSSFYENIQKQFPNSY
eukprot:TRINITY_DN5510_c0_g1_i1.p1 TRINITY_DN5510_c0_g1~~TRINITY_DN5510_c0_g1_i1.p1  ORF type:complete len:289 (-),score=16.97 TRINITY_DN5510_c0_g1_i1:50-832(-)